MTTGRLFRIGSASRITGYSVDSLRRLTTEGKVDCLWADGERLFDDDQIERLKQRRERGRFRRQPA
jgi:DNA-binding transcriptional MerR regulator